MCGVVGKDIWRGGAVFALVGSKPRFHGGEPCGLDGRKIRGGFNFGGGDFCNLWVSFQASRLVHASMGVPPLLALIMPTGVPSPA